MKSLESNPENSNSEIQRIEIAVRVDDPILIKQLLIVYFHFKDSPTYPVFVKFDGSYRPITTTTSEATSKNFRIVEYDEKKDHSFELATIGINPFPSHVGVFIQMFEEDNIKGWGKVKEITREIIAQMERLDFTIESVKPNELLPEGSLLPWERIPEHGADREILKLWCKGYINSEISEMVAKDKETITNILSRLRVQYGEEIVPKKGAISRTLRGKKL